MRLHLPSAEGRSGWWLAVALGLGLFLFEAMLLSWLLVWSP